MKIWNFIMNNKKFNIIFYTFFTAFFGTFAVGYYASNHISLGIFYTILTVMDAIGLVAWIMDKDVKVAVEVTDKKEEN